MSGTTQRPPKLAIRMVSWFVPLNVHEVLLGDLLERYQEVQSPIWFWREVAGAIFFSLIGVLRARVSAVPFAILGALLEQVWFRSHAWKAIWESSTFQSLYGGVVHSPFPIGVVFGFGLQAAISTANISLLLSIFWCFNRSWRWSTLRNSILLCLPLLTVGLLMDSLVPAPYGPLLRFVPTFAALLVASFMSDFAPRHAIRNAA